MTDNRDHTVLILTPPTCPRCSTEKARVFLRSGPELVCPDCKAAEPREIVVVGWDGRSRPMRRYRDELGLPEHLRTVVVDA